MKRNPEHLFQFMMAELGTEGSIDGNKRLVIRGKFVPKVRKDTHPRTSAALQLKDFYSTTALTIAWNVEMLLT